jgi:cytochrome P450
LTGVSRVFLSCCFDGRPVFFPIGFEDSHQEDIQRVPLFLLWASVANSIPAVFWTMYYLLSHRNAWNAFKEEVRVLRDKKTDPNSPFTSEDLHQMVRMQSAFMESLRMASSLRVLRDVREDFLFDLKLDNNNSKHPGKYILQKGTIVVGFTPQLHMDEDIFEAPREFRWDRFMAISEQASQPSFTTSMVNC